MDEYVEPTAILVFRLIMKHLNLGISNKMQDKR